jgi:dihydrofolate reductase
VGCNTYQIFAGHWPHVPDDNPVAAALKKLPEYVVSTTLEKPDWQNSTLLGADAHQRIAALKQEPGDELQLHGSGRPVRAAPVNPARRRPRVPGDMTTN